MEFEPVQYHELNEDDQRKVFAAALEGNDILRYFVRYRNRVWSFSDIIEDIVRERQDVRR